MVEGLEEALDEARTMSHLEGSRRISLVADCRVGYRTGKSFRNTLPECTFSPKSSHKQNISDPLR